MSRAVRHRADQGLAYRGIPIHAPPGVHDDALALVRRNLPSGARVLELGAGSGAFSRRLADAGLEVHAVDFDPTGWSLRDVPLHIADLNSSAWEVPGTPFDAAVAVEVMEHVESPSAFLRSARALVQPGGLIFVTTPNVVSVGSRRAMLLRGELAFFGRGILFEGGHQAILPFWLLEDIFEREGFRVVERAFIGKERVILRPGRSWAKRAVVPIVDLMIARLGRGVPREAAFGACVAYAVRVPEA